MTATLRSLHKSDIPTLIELLKQCNLYYSDVDAPEKLAAKLALDGRRGLMIVAEKNGEFAGFVMASFDGWAAIVWHYCVRPDLRKGTGIGLMLGREITRRLKALGADTVYALVETKNTPMLDLAHKMGFDVTGGADVRVIARPIK